MGDTLTAFKCIWYLLTYSTFTGTRSNQNFNIAAQSSHSIFPRVQTFLTLVMVYIFAHSSIFNIVNRSRTNRYFHEKNSDVFNSLIRRILIFTAKTCDSASTELIFLKRYTRIFFKFRINWLFIFCLHPPPYSSKNLVWCKYNSCFSIWVYIFHGKQYSDLDIIESSEGMRRAIISLWLWRNHEGHVTAGKCSWGGNTSVAI